MHGIGIQLAPFAPTQTSVKLARVDEGVGAGMDEWLEKCYFRESVIHRFSSLKPGVDVDIDLQPLVITTML